MRHGSRLVRGTADYAFRILTYQGLVFNGGTMANLRSRAAERLLRAYMKALSDSNKACREYVSAVRTGAKKPMRNKAGAATQMAAEVKTARTALQRYINKRSKKRGR
jgi:uncharacterized protein with NAD-binding domain and iron-sulfur cluster